jgi:hypothetical protein
VLSASGNTLCCTGCDIRQAGWRCCHSGVHPRAAPLLVPLS